MLGLWTLCLTFRQHPAKDTTYRAKLQIPDYHLILHPSSVGQGVSGETNPAFPRQPAIYQATGYLLRGGSGLPPLAMMGLATDRGLRGTTRLTRARDK